MKFSRVQYISASLVAGLMSAGVALAYDDSAPADSYSSPKADSHPLANHPKPKDWIFFGANLGGTNVSPQASLLEADKSGTQFDLKVLYSHFWNDWVLDLGAGYLINNVKGTDSFSRNWRVKTKAGFAEVSPRYRLNENWQLGLVLNGLFGTDVSFDQNESVDTQVFAVAIGPRINYEWGDDTGRWRLGAHVMTDLNVENRSVLWYMADIQYGFPISSSARPHEPVEQTPEPAPAPEPSPDPLTTTPVPQNPIARVEAPKFAETVGTGTVRIYLPEAILRFKTARSDLRPGSYAILSKVSEYLTH
ncbi:MAG: hypothetical protein EOP09_07820, partial [Proteobacteria bacterium]